MMPLLSTTAGQIVILILAVSIVGGLFRKVALPIALFLAAETLLFTLSPGLLHSYVMFVARVGESLR